MHFGVLWAPTDFSTKPADLGKAVEDLGFESLFVMEHTHVPASRRTPWSGGELTPAFFHMLDPFVALTAIAAATRTIKLGTSVCLVPERDPIILAKQVASLDLLSEGRFVFGAGAGWLVEETENHGTQPSQRWAVLRERVLAMKAIWTEHAAEYHGKFVDFDPIWLWPKPFQRPHPPVLIGGTGPHVLQRVVEYGDGWMPIARSAGLSELLDRIQELKLRAEAAGRGHLPVTVTSWALDPAQVEALHAAGVERYAVALPIAEGANIMSFLENYAALAKEYAGSSVAP